MKCRIQNEFDNSGRFASQSIMTSTWKNFTDALETGEFQANEIDKALQCDFLKVFDDFFNTFSSELEMTLTDVAASYKVGRGTNLKSGENLTADRFIPNSRFITRGNRFSPAGVEWLYLSCAKNLDNAKMCSIKECRAPTGGRFGFCQFQLIPNTSQKVVNLTVADSYKYNELTSSIKRYIKATGKNIANQLRIKYGAVSNPMEENIVQAKRWALYTYAKLLSSSLFVPIPNNADSDKMYAPFQCVAQYFLQKGYVGIIYTSTVYRDAKDLVLFDKSLANPVAPYEDFYI